MRTKFISADNLKDAKEKMKWAKKVVQFDMGYIGFECLEDYSEWIVKQPRPYVF